MEAPTHNLTVRPPVIAILGHIDHGKSTLLDYIRKSNVTAGEAGGITQALSAYEVTHTHEGKEKKITFLDTPGHEAFQSMRFRGAEVADIAVLVVAGDDGVKPQTLEALEAIKSAGIPYIVAITKIDKPGANIDRAKQTLAEHGVYLEGMGGDVPVQGVSGKTGEGIPELLDLMLLVADLSELKGDLSKPGEGIVIESHVDKKKGISATLLIKNGTLSTGKFVVAGTSFAPVRFLENFLGKHLEEASFSSPVQVVGWSSAPEVGSSFTTLDSKKEAEKISLESKKEPPATPEDASSETRFVIPIILKADALGALPAIEHEIAKLENERIIPKVIQKSVGDISENDVKLARGKEGTVVLGFNVGIDARGKEMGERLGINIQTFDIIYRLSEWLRDYAVTITPKVTTEEESGRAKVAKLFSQTKNKQIIGGRMQNGSLHVKSEVRILRNNSEISRGKITNLQRLRSEVSEVTEGEEFGAEIESKMDVAPGDILVSIKLITS